MAEDKYFSYFKALQSEIPDSRLIRDPLSTLAYGTDASFYRLIPQLVVKAHSEKEVRHLLKTADQMGIAVTFRAAGTSLSGQAITDSVLVMAGHNWKEYEVHDKGRRIRLQPGIIGAQANHILAPYGKKIGPDPASINAAMIGGIAANNASGMCCGTAQNSYQTVESMRIVLADGSLLDTADENSRRGFEATHGDMLTQLSELAAGVRANPRLSDRIRQKFKIKNTTGYSLNALIDFENPFDILVHLMIGSEGTLGFISEIVYRTVVEHAHKATALMIFADIESACRSVSFLKTMAADAVELMDRAALQSVENKTGMPDYLKGLPPEATALLVETRAADQKELQSNVAAIVKGLDCIALTESAATRTTSSKSSFQPLECAATLLPVQFTDVVEEYTLLWNIRKGLFPAVGAMRQAGTTVIIEDVAFPMAHLATATLELQHLFDKHGYCEAIIFGHALEGNLHFVFTQDFSVKTEIERYRNFMQDVCDMVTEKYDGSLKAEHGTGRNMAPFVEMEWGSEAYGLMQTIKTIFDPKNQLNPGVILNKNPHAHIENLKPMPAAHGVIDKCIECGFCEVNCPSKNLTLTPRQRIVIQREISRLRATCENPRRLEALEIGYRYLGEQTCAVDGLCATSCPVEINTGEHTKLLRSNQVSRPHFQTMANWTADHYRFVEALVRFGLAITHLAHGIVGTYAMTRISALARKLSGNRIPAWNPYMPQGINGPGFAKTNLSLPFKAVFFPSCINMTMGPAMGDPDQEPLHRVIKRLLTRAGYGVIYPRGRKGFCCGTPFESKGYFDQANRKAEELEKALMAATENGRYPVLCDTGPCVYRLRQVLNPKLQVYEPVEFAHKFLLDKLTITKVPDTVAVHITCSSRKMGLEQVFREVAAACTEHAIFPEEVGCCGFAGDRGFNFPELTASALAELAPAVTDRCSAGYSNSRTCEIGLSQHSGIYYKSICYLLDRCSKSQ